MFTTICYRSNLQQDYGVELTPAYEQNDGVVGERGGTDAANGCFGDEAIP